MIAPKGDNLECAEVPVKTNFEDEVPVTDGVSWKNELLEQQKIAYEICEMKDPDKIIIYQKEYQMKYLTQQQLAENSEELLSWIRENEYQQVLIHWDLDVLSPDDFRSLLCDEPHIPPVSYAVGQMTLDQMIRIIKDVSGIVNVAALGITEFLPWDMIRFQRKLKELDIFN